MASSTMENAVRRFERRFDKAYSPNSLDGTYYFIVSGQPAERIDQFQRAQPRHVLAIVDTDSPRHAAANLLPDSVSYQGHSLSQISVVVSGTKVSRFEFNSLGFGQISNEIEV